MAEITPDGWATWTPVATPRVGDIFEIDVTLSRAQIWWRRFTQLRWTVPTMERRQMVCLSTHTSGDAEACEDQEHIC